MRIYAELDSNETKASDLMESIYHLTENARKALAATVYENNLTFVYLAQTRLDLISSLVAEDNWGKYDKDEG